MHAASVLTTKDGQRVLSVDMRPLVIHLLSGLEQAGIERVVVTLGHAKLLHLAHQQSLITIR